MPVPQRYADLRKFSFLSFLLHVKKWLLLLNTSVFLFSHWKAETTFYLCWCLPLYFTDITGEWNNEPHVDNHFGEPPRHRQENQRMRVGSWELIELPSVSSGVITRAVQREHLKHAIRSRNNKKQAVRQFCHSFQTVFGPLHAAEVGKPGERQAALWRHLQAVSLRPSSQLLPWKQTSVESQRKAVGG